MDAGMDHGIHGDIYPLPIASFILRLYNQYYKRTHAIITA